MDLNPKKEKPLVYRILRVVAITISTVTAGLFVGYAAWFIFSGPFETLLEDITLESVVMIALIAVAIVSYMVAWFHPLNASIIALLAALGYIVIHSVIRETIILGGLEIILLITALLFLIQGLYKRWLENDGMDEIIGPDVDKHDGPDITGLRL